jgi:hypothetical protein
MRTFGHLGALNHAFDFEIHNARNLWLEEKRKGMRSDIGRVKFPVDIDALAPISKCKHTYWYPQSSKKKLVARCNVLCRWRAISLMNMCSGKLEADTRHFKLDPT